MTTTTRTYTLQLNDWELDLLTTATERQLIDCETRLEMDPTEHDHIRFERMAELLAKLEDV